MANGRVAYRVEMSSIVVPPHSSQDERCNRAGICSLFGLVLRYNKALQHFVRLNTLHSFEFAGLEVALTETSIPLTTFVVP
ncbi:unnamed protein product [Phytophthora lilii]|uniref:Unnamed protein product n=1 Tax=Phytophthora lilii TaxID=2077276 RepID=A0A9W6TIH1_9STRA|nr:unnamed protein product [Phytophthora lilii]